MNNLLRRLLKKILKPCKGLFRLITIVEYKILSPLSPPELAKLTQQQIDILLNYQPDAPLARANALNKDLFADVRTIPDRERVEFEEQVRSYCKARNYLPDFTEAVFIHRFRFYLTVNWLRSIVGSDTNITALELGGEEVATDILRNSFPLIQWNHHHGDLRYPWHDVADESVDLVVGMEIVEHLADLPDGYNPGFRRTGLKAMLAETYRVLKDGGILFLTTPNAGSIIHLEYALDGVSPWYYPLHNREYTIDELQDELAQAGFVVERWQAVHCMTVDAYQNHIPAFQLLLNRSCETANRGDDLFIIAKKSA
jgi:SAM-dependent methyltransferase